MKAPALGQLDKLVKVRRWQDEPTIGGSIDQTFDAGVDAWVRLEPVGAALFYGTAQVEAGITHRAIAWRTPELNSPAITGGHVVEVDGLRYRVRRVTNYDLIGQFVLFDLVELGAIDAG